MHLDRPGLGNGQWLKWNYGRRRVLGTKTKERAGQIICSGEVAGAVR